MQVSIYPAVKAPAEFSTQVGVFFRLLKVIVCALLKLDRAFYFFGLII